MRFLLLLATLLAVHSLDVYGQAKKQVTWKTVDGDIQNGYVTIFPRVLKDQDELLFYHFIQDDEDRLRTQENLVLDGDIEWLYNQGDTVLVRQVHKGRSVLMQLLYQGTVKLYRVVQTYPTNQYYLVRDGRWYFIKNAHPREASYEVLRQNCGGLQFPRKLRNDWDALEIVRQLNDCLQAQNHYALSRAQYHRNRIGIGYDLMAIESFENRISKQLGFHGFCQDCDRFVINRGQPYYQKFFSAQFERQIFRYRPVWSYQLGLSFLSMNRRLASTLSNYTGRIPVEEHVRIHALYFSPGVAFNTSFQRRFRFFIGAGGVLPLPIYARRTVQLTDRENTVPEQPITESQRRILQTKPAVYLNWGLQFKLSPQFDIGIRHRMDFLFQRYRYYEDRSVFYSHVFPRSTILASDYRNQLQFRLMYRW